MFFTSILRPNARGCPPHQPQSMYRSSMTLPEVFTGSSQWKGPRYIELYKSFKNVFVLKYNSTYLISFDMLFNLSQAVINSTITPNMTFTKTSQKFGQWSDVRANTVYGLGFGSELELNKVF